MALEDTEDAAEAVVARYQQFPQGQSQCLVSMSFMYGHLFIQVIPDVFEDDQMDIDLPKKKLVSNGKYVVAFLYHAFRPHKYIFRAPVCRNMGGG